MSAAAVAQTATGSRGRTPRSCSQAARAATRSSSWPRVSGASAGCPSTGGVEGQPRAVRVGAVRQHPGQHVARAQLGVGGQRAAQSSALLMVVLLPPAAPRPPRWAASGACSIRISNTSSASPSSRSRSASAVAVGVRVAGRAQAHHRPAQSPAGRDVPGDAVGHGLEEEQRADPPTGGSTVVRTCVGAGPVPAGADQHDRRPRPGGHRRRPVPPPQAPLGHGHRQRGERRVHEPGHRRSAPRPRARASAPAPAPGARAASVDRFGALRRFVGAESARSRAVGGGHGVPTRRAVLAPPKAALRVRA